MSAEIWTRERLLSSENGCHRWLYAEKTDRGDQVWEVLATRQPALQRVLLAHGPAERLRMREGMLYFAAPYREGAPLAAWCAGRAFAERKALCLSLLALVRADETVWRYFPLFAAQQRLFAAQSGAAYARFDLDLRPAGPPGEAERLESLRQTLSGVLGCALPPGTGLAALAGAVADAAPPAAPPEKTAGAFWPQVWMVLLAAALLLAVLAVAGTLLAWISRWTGPPLEHIGSELLTCRW